MQTFPDARQENGPAPGISFAKKAQSEGRLQIACLRKRDGGSATSLNAFSRGPNS
jgi:hypothetical protein